MLSCNKVVLAVVLCATVAAGAVRHLHLDDQYMVNVEITGTGNDSKIALELMVNTTGFVGFGFGPNAAMDGADLFIGGVTGASGNETYGKDYIGTGHNVTEDDQQDWQVLSGKEENGTTTIKITRLLVTNDTTQDVKIEEKNMYVIWSFGATDDVAYHGNSSRNSRQLNLFTADDTDDNNSSGVTVFSISTLIMSLVAAFLRN